MPVASGRNHLGRENHAAISIRQKDGVLWAGKLKPGERVKISDSAFVHLYVAPGALDVDLSGTEVPGRLETGDALRLSDEGLLSATADATSGAEVLIWEMASGIGA